MRSLRHPADDESKRPTKEHFSVDGTMIEARASLKSYRPKDEDAPPEGGGRNRWVGFRGEKRSHDTQASTNDKEGIEGLVRLE